MLFKKKKAENSRVEPKKKNAIFKNKQTCSRGREGEMKGKGRDKIKIIPKGILWHW